MRRGTYPGFPGCLTGRFYEAESVNPEKAFPAANIHIAEGAGTALPKIVEALNRK
jgi:hypothetical protein